MIRDGSEIRQQSAEKSLKAYLYATGQEAVWGHSVAELCADATTIDPEFKELGAAAAPLDKYYIPTRYPNGIALQEATRRRIIITIANM